MEIEKLHEMLTAANISHEWRDRIPSERNRKWYEKEGIWWGWQIIVYDKSGERLVSAIEGYGTYGYGIYGESGDHIEIMGLLTPEEEEYDSVVGWLTAEDVFGRIMAVKDRILAID